MIEQHEQLDGALEYGEQAAPEIHALVDMAAEVAAALGSWTLTATERARIRARAAALLDESGLALWRRVVTGARAPALIGGAAAVALAAGVGIGVAVARGRRHAHPLPA